MTWGQFLFFLLSQAVPRDSLFFFFFIWIKQARFYPRENKQFCNRNVCGALFHWVKAGSSASLEYSASPKEALRNPSHRYLEEIRKEKTGTQVWNYNSSQQISPICFRTCYQGQRLARDSQQHATSIWSGWNYSVSQSWKLWGF